MISTVKGSTPFPLRPLRAGLGDRAVDLEAMEAGATDYLVKGQVSPALLVRAIRYGIERKRGEVERDRLVREPQEPERRERLEVRDAADALVHRPQVRQEVLVLLAELLVRHPRATDDETLGDGREVR